MRPILLEAFVEVVEGLDVWFGGAHELYDVGEEGGVVPLGEIEG